MASAIAFCFVTLWSHGAEADLAVVVNMENPTDSITIEELVNVFLGRSRQLAGGTKVIPIDQVEGEAARIEFYDKVVRKSPSQLNSYWSRLIFAGKGRPPYAVMNDQEVIEFVSANPSMIGYVDQTAVDDSVKVILTIQ
ncbi:MAG: phosphate ABC transporter substrate-binding protein [Ketobacteraceae bacterium]|nr:phosphate ABC transporter substrate-binding protein [Ketobacteraceae bacterium]